MAGSYSWIFFSACFFLILGVCDGQTNLALTTPGITCQASITEDKCGTVYDTISQTSSATFKWDFVNDPVGQYIQINFPVDLSFSYLRIAENSFNTEKNIQDIELSFSNGAPSQTITLTSRVNGFVWEEFDITRVTTGFIRFTIRSSYGLRYNVISEIEIYDTNPGFTTTTTTTTTTTAAPTTAAPSTEAITTAATMPQTEAVSTQATPPVTSQSTSRDTTVMMSSPIMETSQSSIVTQTPPEATSQVDTTTSADGGGDTTADGGDGGGGGRIGGAKDDGDDGLDIEIVVGIICGVVACIFLAVIIIAAICCRTCCAGKDDKNDLEKIDKPVKNGRVDSTYVEIVELPDLLKSSPVAVQDLTTQIQTLSLSEGFKQEFAVIPSGELKTTSDAKRPTTTRKNRFNNIFPYNENRVRLNIQDDCDDEDYINASLISGIVRGPYIAAQGPNDLTMPDFYRMIWEKDVPIVVMLANLEEKGKKKCSQYWPESLGESQTFGNIGVKLESVKTFHHYSVRELQLSQITKTGPTAKTLTQYHFTTWPDEGVPQTATDVIAFHHVVTAAHGDNPHPMVIHCSAGVGRTGTLIALDSLLQQAKTEHVVDIQRFVHHMRTERMNMVQSLAQYRFIYHCLVEKLHCKHVSIPNEQLSLVLPIIMQPEEDATISVIEQQFKILEIFKHKVGSVLDSEVNRDKNRCLNYLPEDDFRPYLANNSSRDTEYVSAIFVMSFKDPYGFFVTTMPLANTVNEFWRLVLDYNIRTIVMLNELLQDGLYWPDSEADEIVFDIVRVTRTAVDDGDVIATTLNVTLLDDKNRSTEVKHFRLKENSSLQPSVGAILDLYEHAAAWRDEQAKSGKPARMLVHCMTGVEVSGLFCATDHIVEKARTEQEVDVFNAVKKIRLTRPSFVPTLDQYQYLYRVADKYLERQQQEATDSADGAGEEEVVEEPDPEPIYANRKSMQPLPIVAEEEEEPEAETSEPEVEEDASSVHHLVIDVL